MKLILAFALCWTFTAAQEQIFVDHDEHDSHRHVEPAWVNTKEQTWMDKYGPQTDQPYSGPLSFAHLPYTKCLENTSATFDIAILGVPFDTAVSYRPGARFGPHAIRAGARRQRPERGYTLSWRTDPYAQGARVIDCGDVPASPFDNALAEDQIATAYRTLLAQPVPKENAEVSEERTWDMTSKLARDGMTHPRMISLGGDHAIVLPILRALHEVYGPISVIHFDAHLDTWGAIPGNFPGQNTEQARFTHGTFFYLAREQGLLSNHSIHAGIRCKLGGLGDLENDRQVGFQLITTDDIDVHGTDGIIKRIRERVGDTPVYLSFDIDVIDPSMAPATGTPEAAGWTVREVKRIIRGLAGLNFVGADVVEVAPAYDHAEVTSIAAADLVHDFLSMFLVSKPPVGHDFWDTTSVP